MNSSKSPDKLIALTGATGFVGGRIMEEALREGHKVKALTRRPVKEIENVQWIQGDLENREALKKLFEGADAFIHTAGLVKARSERDFFAVNADAVKRILDLEPGLEHQDDFHFILVSSLAARHPDLSPYARSKRAGEEELLKNDPGFAYTILRPPAVYGPGDREILKLFKTMQKGIAPAAGRQDNVFSLIHAADLAAAGLAALHHKPAFGQVIEPDDRKQAGYTITEVAKAAEKVLGRKIRTVEIPGAVLHFIAGANEMFASLGAEPAMLSRHKVREMVHADWLADQDTQRRISHWQPKIGLEEGFRETISWYRANKWL